MKFIQPPNKIEFVLGVLVVIAYLLYITHGDKPEVWVMPCCGIYIKNSCGTYYRWITWIETGRPQMPNGWLGKEVTDCVPQER